MSIYKIECIYENDINQGNIVELNVKVLDNLLNQLIR